MKKIKYLALLTIFSCQAAKEFHYFKVGDNYYRITVKEHAFLSSSRYESGYYDEDAVDKYFGEIHRPDSTGRVNPVSDRKDSTSIAIPSNTKLVMILSTNADAVADQIGNLAENEETLETIARLANKNTVTENNNLKQIIANHNKKDSAIIDFGNSTLVGIADTDKTVANLAQLQNYLLSLINVIASSTGRKIPFASFPDAQKWFNENF